MKKCKYCMSYIDDNAKVCPNCRKSQNQKKKTVIIFILILFVLFLLVFVPKVIGIIKEAKIKKFEMKAHEYIERVKIQFLYEDYDKEYMCYRIDEEEYLGSVKVEHNSETEKYTYEIWLSNGKYYASGEGINIRAVESSKEATTNCHRY